tara:strand:- start:1528 stop:2049 length:522 start_codon:yes stop_codon:yes gene_type:complete
MPKFKDYPDFTPNLTPRQIFMMGSFIEWGGYWRPIYSSVVEKELSNQHNEFSFLKDLPEEFLINPSRDYKKLNKYGVKCGSSLGDWEGKGWINPQDPYGWIQWYCRFYSGRRTPDDLRQIKRWLNIAGPNGRFRKMLINKINKVGTSFDDFNISPVIRQTLQHWGFKLTEKDL